MKKALVLAYYFPPIAASGSLRPTGITKYLSLFGYQPTVVTTPPECVYPPGGTDETLSEFIQPSLEVVPIAYRNTLKELLAWRERILPQKQPASDDGAEATSAAGPAPEDSGVSLKDQILDRLFIFPDHQKYWIKPTVKFATSLPEEKRPDVVFATANPWSSLIAGQQISQKLNVPWVADFRDPWWRNPKPQPNSKLLDQVAHLEAQVMQSAAMVIANTQRLAEQFRADYPHAAEKIVTVNNGFLADLVPDNVATERHVDDVYEICHFGSVYPLRNPKTLLQAFSALAESAPALATKVRLRFVGGWDVEDPECDAIAQELINKDLVRREPSVSRNEVMRLMQNASALLILQQDFPLQIPAKLYEYISVQRPVIVVGGEGATTDLVRMNALGSCFANEKPALKEMLEQIASGTARPPKATGEQAAQFEYKSIAGKIAEVLDRAVNG